MILLSILSGVLFILLVGVFRLALRASRQNREYEEFYQNTISDVGNILTMLDRLMGRQFISDDSDVQNVHRVMAIFHDTLVGYNNVGKQNEKKKKKKKGK